MHPDLCLQCITLHQGSVPVTVLLLVNSFFFFLFFFFVTHVADVFILRKLKSLTWWILKCCSRKGFYGLRSLRVICLGSVNLLPALQSHVLYISVKVALQSAGSNEIGSAQSYVAVKSALHRGSVSGGEENTERWRRGNDECLLSIKKEKGKCPSASTTLHV